MKRTLFRPAAAGAGGNSYQVFPLQDGTGVIDALVTPSQFSDGHYQNTADGANWANYPAAAGADYDLPIYFLVTPAAQPAKTEGGPPNAGSKCCCPPCCLPAAAGGR